MTSIKILLQFFLTFFLFTACSTNTVLNEPIAPGAPGQKPVWSYGGKTGIGTSYETYSNKQFSDNGETGKISKVWFSIAKGIVTETMFGLIHEAQLKEMQFIIVGDGFIDEEKNDTESSISYLYTDDAGRPLSLAYKIINRDKDGKYEIEKHVFTDPDEQSLFVRVIFRSKGKGIIPYLYVNPHMNNTGGSDQAWVDLKSLNASEGDNYMTVLGSRKFKQASAGFVGVSDGINELYNNTELEHLYQSTGSESGNVAMIAKLKPMTFKGTTYDFVIGFGQSNDESKLAASTTLKRGYKKVLASYNGEGEAIGWIDYLAGLNQMERLSTMSTDGGRLLNASAMVLKAQEDKTNAGALIASLSNPWGETTSAVDPSTGYKGVWPRDFYQCAMAMMALGDTVSPLVAFEFLHKVQITNNTSGNKGVTGWFMQKTHVDGEKEWISIQLDQTAMPIMLGWKLWKKRLMSKDETIHWYNQLLKPAAQFIVTGGDVDLDWNKVTIVPPATQQERWEEQSGYSPSTTAAIIAGLVCASDLAQLANDTVGSEAYLYAADCYEASIEKTMFTTNGEYHRGAGDGKYFIRITANNNPNDRKHLGDNNGKPGLDETLILDAGFLELARYGVRKANAQSILETLPELDDTTREDNLRVKYLFHFGDDSVAYPGWRRYGNDGYGEDITAGLGYGQNPGAQRGRVWPIFTGERGHYELALAKENGLLDIDNLRNIYVRALEYFANDGLMLPEQIWDGIGTTPAGYRIGEGTNSATPLAWSHAEYIKLLRSLYDKQVWDSYSSVELRYSK